MFLHREVSLANSVGMLPVLHRNPLYLLITFLHLGCALSIVAHTGVFYYKYHETEFLQSTFASALFLNVSTHALMCCIGLAKNRAFLRLYFRMKAIYDDPAKYDRALRHTVDWWLKVALLSICSFLLLAIVLVILSPLIFMAREYLETGQVVHSRYELPIPYASPFYDLRASPNYELVYGTFALAFPTAVYFAYAFCFLFMGMAAHVYGMFKSLARKFRELSHKPSAHPVTMRGFRERYKDLIEFQNEIYGIVKDMEAVFGALFFLQFAFTTVAICTQAYLATQNTSNGRLFLNILYTITAAGEFFTYIISGSLITTGNERVAEALLETDWLAMDMRARESFSFMVGRSSRICRVSFLGWVHCSLESLMFVVTSSFNMFTVLQRIARSQKSG